MAFFSGRLSGLYWTHSHGDLGAEAWQRFLGELGDFCAAAAADGEGAGLLSITHRSSAPDAERRARLTEVLSPEATTAIRAHAFVTDSVVVRGVLNPLGWMAKPAYPERMFNDPIAALDWMSTRVRSVITREVVRVIQAKVPPGELDPSLAMPM